MFKLLLAAALLLCAAKADAQDEYIGNQPPPEQSAPATPEQPSAAAPQAAPQTGSAVSPSYVSLAPDLNAYYMYADGGFDGNWYIGYNNCWTVKLPPAPAGKYVKAFIGARLGRGKSMPQTGKPWVKVPMDGKIFMGLSQSQAFSTEQSYFLVENKDIPREGLPSESVEGSGSAQWFWAEVPLSAVAFDKPNYLAIWAQSELFVDNTTSPIIAGAETKNVTDSVWANNSVKGTPPRDADVSSGTGINGMAPALVLKLIPKNDVKIAPEGLVSVQEGDNIRFSFSATGRDIRAVWLEMSYDRFDWQRITRYLYQPPYSFTIPKSQLPTLDLYFIRAAAVDSMENTGYSKELTLR
jgi:hypothetical protein